MPWSSLVALTVKNLPAIREIWVQSLGWGDTLEEEMATHFSIFAWRIPMDRVVWWAIVHGVSKSWMQLSTATEHISFYPRKDGFLLLSLFPSLHHHQKQLIVCLFRGLLLYPLGHWKPGEERKGEVNLSIQKSFIKAFKQCTLLLPNQVARKI